MDHVYFLRHAIPEYDAKETKMLSPKEHRSSFTPEELKRVPQSFTRVVIYNGASYYGCVKRGSVAATAHTVAPWKMHLTPPRSSIVQDPDRTQRQPRVAGSLVMFANMLHEILVVARACDEGLLKMNADSEPLTDTEFSDLATSMVYLNDVLVNFDAAVLGIVNDASVRQAYGISPSMKLGRDVWRASTPEGISGDTKLVGQLGVFPTEFPFARMAGNHASSGRRTVGVTRGRILNSSHFCGECLKSDKVPGIWTQYMKAAKAQRKGTSFIYQEISCQGNSVPLASIAGTFCPSMQEEKAFKALVAIISDLPGFVRDVQN